MKKLYYLLGATAFLITYRLFGPYYLAGFNNLFPSLKVDRYQDISYAREDELKLDLYRPANKEEELPVIFFIHGGGWRKYSKNLFKFIGRVLAQKGYLVVIPDYRLAPDHTYPTQIQDTARALKWTQERIQEYGGSDCHIFLSGHSAGSHLAALLGFSRSWQEEYQIDPQAISGHILISGVYLFPDFEQGHEVVKNFVTKRKYWQEAQPINNLHQNVAPCLLFHGARDRIVSASHSVILQQKLSALGIKNKLVLMDRLNHKNILLKINENSFKFWQHVEQFIEEEITNN